MQNFYMRIRLFDKTSFVTHPPQSFDKTLERPLIRNLIWILSSSPSLSEKRSKVIDELWPNSDPQHSNNRLYHTLHIVRKSFADASADIEPLIELQRDDLRLNIPSWISIDVVEFRALANRTAGRLGRLQAINEAIELYGSGLSVEVRNGNYMDQRSRELEQVCVDLLEEGLDICAETGRLDSQIPLLEKLFALERADIDLYKLYADLLIKQQRRASALESLNEYRLIATERNDQALARNLEALIFATQKAVNSNGASDKTPATSVSNLVQSAVDPSSRTPEYGEDVSAVISMLMTPKARLVVIVGGRGFGKTRTARAAAHACQALFRGRPIEIDCTTIVDAQTLFKVVAHEVNRGDYQEEHGSPIAREKQIGLQQMIFLRNLNPVSELAIVIEQIIRDSPDLKLLVTAESRLRISFEYVYQVKAPSAHRTPHALDTLGRALTEQLLSKGVQRSELEDWHDALSLIAAELDGIPLALQTLANRLAVVDLPKLLSHAINETSGGYYRLNLNKQLLAIFDDIDEHIYRNVYEIHADFLNAAAVFEGSFTKKDWLAVSGRNNEQGLDDAIAKLMDFGLITRSSRFEDFQRVSGFDLLKSAKRFTRRQLHLLGQSLDYQKRYLHWITVDGPPSRVVVEGVVVRAGWFDHRMEDVERCLWLLPNLSGMSSALDFLLSNHEEWLCSQYGDRLLTWMRQVDPSEIQLHGGFLAKFYILRARLSRRIGEHHNAWVDAQTALAAVSSCGSDTLVSQIEDFASQIDSSTLSLPSSRQHSIPTLISKTQAGEHILKSARMAAACGSFTRAIELAKHASLLFTKASQTLGLLRALRFEQRMHFAIGALDAARACNSHSGSIAMLHGSAEELLLNRVMDAEIEISNKRFSSAIATINELLNNQNSFRISKATCRTFKVLAWSYMLSDMDTMAGVFCSELKRQATRAADFAHLSNSYLLEALLCARGGNANSASELLAAAKQIADSPARAADPQMELVSLIYIFAKIGRRDAAKAAVAALGSFMANPVHRFRPVIAAYALRVCDDLADSESKCLEQIIYSNSDERLQPQVLAA